MESVLPINELQCSKCEQSVPEIHDCQCAGKNADFVKLTDYYSRNFKPVGVWKIDLQNPMLPLFHEKNKGLESRCLYYYGICPTCDGFMTVGTSFSDYRATGIRLIESAVNELLSYEPFGYKMIDTKEQAYSIIENFLYDHKHLLEEYKQSNGGIK